MNLAPTYRDWVTFFSVTLPDEVREFIIAQECGSLPALDELLSFLAALAHGTANNPTVPEPLTRAFSNLAMHLGDVHGLDLPNGIELTDEQKDSLARVVSVLLPEPTFIGVYGRYPSNN